MNKTIEGNPICGQHRVKMVEKLDIGFKPRLECPVCVMSSFLDWHIAKALTLSKENPEMSAKHQEKAQEYISQISEMYKKENK